MSWSKEIHVQSGHTMFVKKIEREELPDTLPENTELYDTFYVVKNWDDEGVVFMYLAKGYATAKDEYVVWYRSGKFWSGFGNSLKEAIEGAQRDGWYYA